ncbi:extracellular solute-binding protein family 1 [[Leptolyngbya] sp. PCC 7376]|uniref:ABC transporter substrate-binding protein n=1 Tax=[Leptolyngbya] sp. PCC 7376 TaxID=111781 RepID=UPI00029EDA1A|nr:extracellular solute-binding protein [[Leptolyngbya] sp. PCC 7376]AFY38127.1 extracellular solute-binding protein family 1 [[Leptolyngbya] sp. PCC 7376]
MIEGNYDHDNRLPMSEQGTQFNGVQLNRRKFLKGSAAALSGFALSSCGWRLADVKPTARRTSTDTLYIYTWAGYTDDALLKQFEAETGIRAIADVFDSNEAMLARIQAQGGGDYSIIYPSDYIVQEMIDLELLQELDHSQINGLDNLFETFTDPGYDPGNSYSIPISWGTTGLIYNKSALDEAPTDWNYLWDNADKLQRRMTLLNDVREVLGASLKSLGYSYNSTEEAQVKAAYERLVELRPAIASFNSDAWRTQILSGDLLVAMCYSSDANEITEEDDNFAYVVPSSGSSVWADTLVIPRTAPNVPGAYAWMSFMMRAQVSAEITQRLSFATPNRPGYELLPEDVRTNPNLFPSSETIDRCEGLKPLGEEVGEIYDRYWTKLTSG